MSKRSISQQQAFRVKKIQTRRTSEAKLQHSGVVIAHYGKYSDVASNHNIYHCKLRQNLGDIVVGDNVIFQLNLHGEAVITALEPRKSKLYRQDDRGQEKLIAANVTQVMVVMAVKPEPSWLLLDSYLAAIQLLNLSSIIVFNKVDLVTDYYSEYWALYTKLEIPVIKTSVKTGEGIAELLTAMQNQRSVFVGQSGVGKSSLIQALLPKEILQVGELHAATGLGTHTTSTARLYELSNEGTLIDSPGIRDFNLWPVSANQLSKAFKEFVPYLNQCKFRNCSHKHEPECAIQLAVNEGKISTSRWRSFNVLLERFKDKI